ncbi:hypothetical protein [Streptomyces sp. NPDC093223]|uniref:hypothetical protein n=1 Tax=Streptomyces sp. NPDC093223 TaxID=3366033 RepID=UPI00380A5642
MSALTTALTAPLPEPAREALAKLEHAFHPADPTGKAAQLLKSRVRAAQLADLADAGYALSDLDADDLAHSMDLMAGLQPLIGGA